MALINDIKEHIKNNAKRVRQSGLVALYDIRPGNGAGLFLQLRSPHGAVISMKDEISSNYMVLSPTVCYLLSTLVTNVISISSNSRPTSTRKCISSLECHDMTPSDVRFLSTFSIRTSSGPSVGMSDVITVEPTTHKTSNVQITVCFIR